MSSTFDLRHQNTNLSAKIVAAMERISESYRVLLWEQAKVYGISPIQIQILIFIQYHDQALCSVSYLAREFNMTKPTISDAIKALFAKRLINKETSATDRRAYTISLTAEGEQMVSMAESFADPLQSIIDDLNQATQENLFSGLNTVIQSLHRADILTIQRNCLSCHYYSKKEGTHHCALLSATILSRELRIDCPEHEARA